jgi:hypothetical protein
VPPRARESFARLKEASANAWAGGTPFIFSQNPDPTLVSAVRSAWPNPDYDSDTVLRTLEESLAINAVARTGTAWASSDRRAQWMRNEFAKRLREEQKRGSQPKVMMKFGYNHMIRGENYVNIFDLGSMPGEVLTRVLSNATATGHEVIDLRALRPLATRGLESWNSDVIRTILGYDAAVIWKGARASSA